MNMMVHIRQAASQADVRLESGLAAASSDHGSNGEDRREQPLPEAMEEEGTRRSGRF